MFSCTCLDQRRSAFGDNEDSELGAFTLSGHPFGGSVAFTPLQLSQIPSVHFDSLSTV